MTNPLKRAVLGAAAAVATACPAFADKPDFPPFDEVSKDYEKVVSTTDGGSFYNVWERTKDGQMLAELPRGYSRQKHFFAMTVGSGDIWAGLQGAELYLYWKRFDDRMALIQPDLSIRSTGDQESKTAVDRTFTDRVLLDVPIKCMGPSGQPVIDLDELLLGNATEFFGYQGGGLNTRLAKIESAKAFPENIEIAFTVPGRGGKFKTLHWSISHIKGSPGYKPREADERVGYFTTTYNDLGQYERDEKWTRYINRWHVQKADPSLRVSPPKEPIVFYVEHTTPKRYRRFVRQGIDYWNKAFEQVGIVGAIEVRYQDASTGAYMDIDPEDVRYNFIRWVSNNISTAIGPSRVNPKTGEILDADVVLTDGWISAFWYYWNEYLPEVMTEGFTADTMAWLAKNPKWDPRVRLAPPSQRDYIAAQIQAKGPQAYGGHPAAHVETHLLGDDEYDGLAHRTSQLNGFCMAAKGRAFDMATMRMHLEILGLTDEDEHEHEHEHAEDEECCAEGGECCAEGDACEMCEDDEKCLMCQEKEARKDADIIDGVPDWFVGPALADLVAHEVGHTLGLRHNFKASALYTLEEINSPEVKGKPQTASVMDYNPVNINMEDGPIQGDYYMIDIGPYDMWAIEYGYTLNKKDLPEILKQSVKPEHAYATDEDTWGPDPYARRYDFGKDVHNYARSRMRLAEYHRARILDKFVEEGDSWAKARRGYEITLGTQASSLSMMSNWVGGSYVTRAKKGESGDQIPVVSVEAEKQREALEWVIDHSFYDESYGLTPELLQYMTVEKWWDGGGSSIFADPTWPVHDRIMGIQASVMTQLLNPTTLQRAYDNEFRTPDDQDVLSLAEMMGKITESVWSEVTGRVEKRHTTRKPMVSSLRRNLQREHLNRLIDLTRADQGYTAAFKPITNLSLSHLRDLKGRIGKTLDSANSKVDAYTRAHLQEAHERISQVLDAQYIHNTNDFGGGYGSSLLFFKEGEDPSDR